MGWRVVLAVLLAAGTASAGPTRKVLVESDPPGATVYLNDKESGPVCNATPCTIEVPATGEQQLIIEESSYAPEFTTVDPKQRGGKLQVKVSLKKAVGTIVIDTPKGASVTVDEVDKGKVPARIEVESGGHRVVVTANGKAVFEDFVSVDNGEEVPVTPAATMTQAPDGEHNDIDQNPKPPTPGRTHKRPYVSASLAFDVGFRKFSYADVKPNSMGKTLLRDEDEGGQILAGPVVEVWPLEIAGLDVATGLSLLFRFQYGLNGQEVSGNGVANKLTTFWESYEIGAKYRWIIADQVAIEAGGGYLRDTYRFNGMDADVLLVPDVDYQSIRLGARAAYIAGQFEPYLAVESRIVMDGGNISKRFPMGASASGLHGALGVVAHFGAIGVRVEGALTQYSWTFTSDPGMSEYVATGGADSIKQVSLSVGYAY